MQTEKLPTIKIWLGRQGIQFLEILMHAEEKKMQYTRRHI